MNYLKDNGTKFPEIKDYTFGIAVAYWFKRCLADRPKSWTNSYFGMEGSEYEVKPTEECWAEWAKKWFSQFETEE